MLNSIGLTRKTLAAGGRAVLFAALLAALAPLAAVQAASAQGLLAAAGDTPSAPEGPFARNFTFSDPPVPAPSAAFQTLDGDAASLGDFKGKVVLVNFWATWCAPCVAEMPALERLHQALVDEGFAVLAISEDRGGAATVNPFLARLDLQFLPVYLDPKAALGRAFALKGLPTSFLIGRDGNVIAGLVGPAEWDSPAALEFMRHYLGTAPAITNTAG